MMNGSDGSKLPRWKVLQYLPEKEQDKYATQVEISIPEEDLYANIEPILITKDLYIRLAKTQVIQNVDIADM